MILIQSNADDDSTNDVLDWLYLMCGNKVSIVRHNGTAVIEGITLKIGSNSMGKFNFNQQKIEGITARWFRRGQYRHNPIIMSKGAGPSEEFASRLEDLLVNEGQSILNGLEQCSRSINKKADLKKDKIEMLLHAVKSELSVPDSLITNDTRELNLFIAKHGKVITKAIHQNYIAYSYEVSTIKFSLDTTLIENDEQDTVQHLLSAPVLIQEYVEKRYELRIFYLMGKCYAMAIFSQANEQTKIDFRNYDKKRPNRCVPYLLPAVIEEKLKIFMHSIDINCGSIDMIYTPEGDYIFLEVNPVGQFQWLSKNCNYDIERQIAKYLSIT